MASPPSAYVTAVPDDYDVAQCSSSSASEASTSWPSPSAWDFDAFPWSESNGNSPQTVASSTLQSSTPGSYARPSGFTPMASQNTHPHSRSPSQSISMSQKWQQIITSNACPPSLVEHPDVTDEITEELSKRDQVDATIRQARSQQTYDEEQRRRLAWAMRMILTRPEESAEVCAALRKAA
ncbi:hypothetical protein FKW77_008223 [Venturia effusa]|uniref:Uncharacterized protein n=1 Tax=Venturia effusa TaxID=50376 RepID=A0A517L5W2_9PEZI|nr:hypothetical protein FKW77_008223 [Venturia effusa]